MKNKYYLYTILALLLSISCQKFGHHLALETGTLTNKTASGAQVDAMVIDVGESGLTEHGWCIATEPEPTVSNTKINNGSKSQYGVYNNEITGLDPASKYYIRPYITNGSQTVYGEQLELQTEALQFTINTPVANTIWAKGKTFSINWAANVNDKINIDLYKGATLVKNIVQGIENTGSYNWPITNELENGEDYKIIITSSENEIIKEETALFSIYDNAPPGVSTEDASNISYFTAQIGGTLVHFGTEEAVIQHGHCWSKNENPTIDDNKTELGAKSSLETFTSDLSEMEDNTTYYVRAYAVSEEGVAYGEQNSFTTLDAIPPTVVTSEVTSISYTSATCGGEVTSKGTHDVISRGVCWSTLENPTVDDYKFENGAGLGTYPVNIENLENNTTYYLRAFAINVVDTSYGEHKTFTTLVPTIPTVVTTPATNISYTSATCGGTIQSDGGTQIISQGVCWNTAGNPTVNDSKTEYVFAETNFLVDIEGLGNGVKYYMRAFAENSKGLNYGEELEVVTLPAPICVDVDGNEYKVVLIGEQWWMAENLKTTKFNDGSNIKYVPDSAEWRNTFTAAYCYYDNDELNNKELYGTLYNWYSVNQGKLCPTGWELPNDYDWNILSEFLGGWDDMGGKLKAISEWELPNLGAVDQFAFSALPSGCREDVGSFKGSREYLGMWTNVSYSIASAWLVDMSYNSSKSRITLFFKTYGLSVRCIKK